MQDTSIEEGGQLEVGRSFNFRLQRAPIMTTRWTFTLMEIQSREPNFGHLQWRGV